MRHKHQRFVSRISVDSVQAKQSKERTSIIDVRINLNEKIVGWWGLSLLKGSVRDIICFK